MLRRTVFEVAATTLVMSLFSASCGPKLLPTHITSDTQNRIALCTGGYSSNAAREIAAEISRRGGTLITEAETQERGVDTFAFGEHRGETAVAMYNAYVRCIQEDVGSQRDARDEPRRRYHEVGITATGEAVVQIPIPGSERPNEEVQLQIVTENGAWSSRGTPEWRGRCSPWPLRRIGNNESYVYRFFVERAASCTITLFAMEGEQGYYWSQEYHVQVRAR